MLKAPFPYFGGKSRIANLVWQYLGDVDHYVEPFAGSLAVLLGRPTAPKIEAVNDIDVYIANFWRALQHAPDEVAYYADYPVNEADLTARHIWLVQNNEERLARLHGDPDYYDAKVAGWWVWGISTWIGSGWCAGNGKWTSVDGKLVESKGKGGVSRRTVHLGGGKGVHRLSNRSGLQEYFSQLADRLRYVNVTCGDWSRVVTKGALSYGAHVGVFLDPPYLTTIRDVGIYNSDADHGDVSQAVAAWCKENGDNPRYRIVLAGYEGEHDMPDTWRVVPWKANTTYQTSRSSGGNKENRDKERLWISPHCLKVGLL